MNKIFARAIAEVERLPEREQEVIGCLMLEEIEAERSWDQRFAASEGKLAELA